MRRRADTALRALAATLIASIAAPCPAQGAAEPAASSPAARHRHVPATLDAAAGRAALERALDWLVRNQNADGSWATGVIEGLLDSGYSVASFYDWKLAASALACMALRRGPLTPERQGALQRGLGWFSVTRLPKRGSDWDNDTMWAALYGVALCVEAAEDPRLQDPELAEPLQRRGRELLEIVVKNQVPTGGWAYYDDPPYSRRPKWGTSFCTALILPPLLRARALGWLDDGAVIDRAVRYVQRCRLPNGAYEYDLNPIPRAPAGEHINQVKGSLGRIQVGNWALRRALGAEAVSDDDLRLGLRAFFADHRFLDVARMRPIPHEAFYANAGYFYFFGHLYAAEVIALLPQEEREGWHRRLRPHIVKTQRQDGSACDYLGQSYMVVAGTAYSAMALALGLPEPR